ncbi:hypothetical protein ASPZODRAFT_166955 [Penicilliopsis zonata CBS 506.65]|uniref:RGS domain-containing protein n=1 Tax=Penicilliopsis zonata CBS 506.65 TaxID=1073090 RepID=A0A1L9SI12_9EURO|nr:hypothetical protein ASPZODRAFT_166955 [Penicilliopsis zonata CBS 506.65]OJJ46746.1 hypothetical protein ASPZODRAFT_166955 [Penicilliopsis zonata CBS 506.65]
MPTTFSGSHCREGSQAQAYPVPDSDYPPVSLPSDILSSSPAFLPSDLSSSSSSSSPTIATTNPTTSSSTAATTTTTTTTKTTTTTPPPPPTIVTATTTQTPSLPVTTFQGSVIGSIRGNRRSFAALAREKTTSAFASLSAIGGTANASLRASASYSVLGSKQHSYKNSISDFVSSSLAPDHHYHHHHPDSSLHPSQDILDSLPALGSRTPTFERRRHTLQRIPSYMTENPFADPADSAAAAAAAKSGPKMHQTSSRLLRMTEDERPFTKDFMDLFSTLMVSLRLDAHRIRFTRYDHTFTSEEAINNLGSLKFSQSNRMPDPKDPSRIVTTTTTTTFSMAKEMARSVCQRFVDARFIEPVDGRPVAMFPMKGALFQLTPKGINILQRFCQRNGITARHVMDVLESPRNTMQLVNLERDLETDKLSHDRATIEVIFRRFAGQDGPNIKSSISSSDSDSLSDYTNGLVGVKMARERKIGDKMFPNTFTGKAAADWLMDCSTTIERRETSLIAELFVKYGLISMLQDDKAYPQGDSNTATFQPSKYAIYTISDRGQRVCGWIARDKQKDMPAFDRGIPRDSNNARLTHILQDPALRLLFREFLRYSLCEENLSFYVDVSEFTANYHKAEKMGTFKRVDAVRETLAAAYGLYNAFLAPGSPCELNIDHALRNSLASRMTKAVGDDESMLKSLQEVVHLFELAQTSVFKLMSSDSIPKFLRDPKYASVVQEHDLDTIGNPRSFSPTPVPIPERSMSRSNRS